MSFALTFRDSELLDSSVVGADGTVHYKTSTTHGFRGRKITTITAASGLVGMIDWREKTLTIDGAQRGWDAVESHAGGTSSSNSEREWNWGNRPYKLEYRDSHEELLATPNFTGPVGAVRFIPYRARLMHANELATIDFPHELQDETERMFLLMAILYTERHRQDQANRAASASGGAAASSASTASATIAASC